MRHLGSLRWRLISWWIPSGFLDPRIFLLIDLLDSEDSEESDPLGATYSRMAGLIAGCYLVRRGMTGEETVKEIKMLRREELADQLPSPETETQRNMVLNWKG